MSQWYLLGAGLVFVGWLSGVGTAYLIFNQEAENCSHTMKGQITVLFLMWLGGFFMGFGIAWQMIRVLR